MINDSILYGELLDSYKKFTDKYLNNNQSGQEETLHPVCLEVFSEFYWGVNCTKCVGAPFFIPTDSFKTEIIDNREKIAIFSGKDMAIAAKEKFIRIENQVFGYNTPLLKGVITGNARMLEVTPNGIFELSLHADSRDSNNWFRFYSNDCLMRAALEHNLTLEEIKNRFILGYSYHLDGSVQELPMLKVNVSRAYFAMLCNKIYREGLSNLAQIAMRGYSFEITDEDRKKFTVSSDGHEMPQDVNVLNKNSELVKL